MKSCRVTAHIVLWVLGPVWVGSAVLQHIPNGKRLISGLHRETMSGLTDVAFTGPVTLPCAAEVLLTCVPRT